MSLKNQPYLHLYVQDLLTDEKLVQCSASAHGVYFLLMCIMTKTQEYGKILLRQNIKQNSSKRQAKQQAKVKHLLEICLAFATQLAKNMPFEVVTIRDALIELVTEDVLQIEGVYLVQKRMVKDAAISHQRRLAGGKGGKKRVSNERSNREFSDNDFAQANFQANFKQIHDNDNDNKGDKGEGGREGENFAAEKNIPEPIFNVFVKTFEQFSTLGKSFVEGVDENDFREWKDFIQLCGNDQYGFSPDIFTVKKFLYPKDFTVLKKDHGFIRELWVPVIRKTLSLGLEPKQNLFFRFLDVMSWRKENKIVTPKTDQQVKQAGSEAQDYTTNKF